MKKITFILFFVIPLVSFSQEKEHYNDASKQFMEHYNEANYKGVFNMFDVAMQQALTKEKTVLFFQDIKTNLGAMKSMEFLKTKKTAHIFKTTFDNGIRDILIYLNQDNKIGGLYISAHIPENLPVLERNTTKMILPFNEAWFVFWGGTTVSENYHVAHENQKGAYDLMILKEGKSYREDRTRNENFYVFGKTIIAPCNAKVVKVISGVPDNVPGEINTKKVTGNTVILQTKNKEYILFAHFKEKSIVVKEGQDVKQGDKLGQCGNSGNSK